MVILRGFKRKSGQMVNKDSGELIKWDNYELYFETDEDKDVVGIKPLIQAARAVDLQVMGAASLADLIGKPCFVMHDMDVKTDENGRAKMFVKCIMPAPTAAPTSAATEAKR